jgi:hypothetical protein
MKTLGDYCIQTHLPFNALHRLWLLVVIKDIGTVCSV